MSTLHDEIETMKDRLADLQERVERTNIADEEFVESIDHVADDEAVVFNYALSPKMIAEIRESEWEIHHCEAVDCDDSDRIPGSRGVQVSFNYVGDTS